MRGSLPFDCSFSFAIPEHPQRRCFHFFIDVRFSVLLFRLVHRANRGFGRIYLILSALAGYIPYSTSRPGAKQVYLGCWWSQTKHLFPPPPPFLSCLHYFPLRAVDRIASVRPIYSHLPPLLSTSPPIIFCPLFVSPLPSV